MPTAKVAGDDAPTYRHGPPRLMIKVKSVDRINACAHTIIKHVKKAASFDVPIAVKAYCGDKDTADYWASLWSQFGFKPERLLAATIYFEEHPKRLKEIVPNFPPSSTRFVFK